MIGTNWLFGFFEVEWLWYLDSFDSDDQLKMIGVFNQHVFLFLAELKRFGSPGKKSILLLRKQWLCLEAPEIFSSVAFSYSLLGQRVFIRIY